MTILVSKESTMSKASKRAGDRKIAGAGKADVRFAASPSSLVEVDIAAYSHAGGARRVNEDHYLVVRADRSLQTILSNFPEGVLPSTFDETAYGMCVADGMGGLPGGRIASGLALRRLVDLVVKTPDWIMRMNKRKALIVTRRITQRFRAVDGTLRKLSAKDPGLAGMGTTMTVACSLGEDLFLSHVGDSRAYLMRGEELRQLTRDHTLAQAMIEAGVATPEDETVQGLRRVLTAALGATARPTDPEIQHLYLEDRDQLLLCTDGLTEYVDSTIISSILSNAGSVDKACRALIDAASNSGGNDNTTVILARYRFPQDM